MITLHLGIGEGDIKEVQIECSESLIRYIENELLPIENRVWLVSEEDDGEIIITEDLNFVTHLIESNTWFLRETDFFMQEYDSYESAYSVALDMKEPNKLCYR